MYGSLILTASQRNSGTLYNPQWNISLPFNTMKNPVIRINQVIYSASGPTYGYTDSNTLAINVNEVSWANDVTSAGNSVKNLWKYTKGSIDNAPSQWCPIGPDLLKGGTLTLNVNPTASNVLVNSNVTYPPVYISTTSSNIGGRAYGNGNYTLTSTSVYNGYPLQSVWNGANATFLSSNAAGLGYGSTTGIYIGPNSFVSSGTTYAGEYFTMQLPQNTASIQLSSYTLTSPNVAWSQIPPNSWVLSGSCDGINWKTLDIRSGIYTTGASLQTTYNINTTTYSDALSTFNYFRFCCLAVGNSDATSNRLRFGIGGLSLKGSVQLYKDVTICCQLKESR